MKGGFIRKSRGALIQEVKEAFTQHVKGALIR